VGENRQPKKPVRSEKEIVIGNPSHTTVGKQHFQGGLAEGGSKERYMSQAEKTREGVIPTEHASKRKKPKKKWTWGGERNGQSKWHLPRGTKSKERGGGAEQAVRVRRARTGPRARSKEGSTRKTSHCHNCGFQGDAIRRLGPKKGEQKTTGHKTSEKNPVPRPPSATRGEEKKEKRPNPKARERENKKSTETAFLGKRITGLTTRRKKWGLQKTSKKKWNVR